MDITEARNLIKDQNTDREMEMALLYSINHELGEIKNILKEQRSGQPNTKKRIKT